MDINIRPVWAEVDLDCIEHNIREIKKVVRDKKIIAVVKADAYGHGAVDIAPILIKEGADKLAVAVITEALELRKNDIQAPVLILGYTPINLAKDLLKYNIEQTVYTLEYAESLSSIAKEMGAALDIHIAVDTGMGRIGFIPDEKSIEEIVKISNIDNLNIKGIFTHFATADENDKEYTNLQMNKFKEFCEKLENLGVDLGDKHLSNSAAILDMEVAYFDAVRPGIILYGYYPSNEVKKDKIKLMPALTLKSNVVHVKELPEGEYISYGRTFKTNRISKIATLPIGYADGYSRALNGKAKVIINGKLAPVVGRICMDQCMVDVTDIGKVSLDDEVILLGKQCDTKFDADDIAREIDTINYEIICMIGKRVPRLYKRGERVIKARNYL